MLYYSIAKVERNVSRGEFSSVCYIERDVDQLYQLQNIGVLLFVGMMIEEMLERYSIGD